MDNQQITRLRSQRGTASKTSRAVVKIGAFLPIPLQYPYFWPCKREVKNTAYLTCLSRFSIERLTVLEGMPPASRQSKATYQSGAVLIVSLVMLLLLTLIGTTGMQTTSLEERMVGNMRDQNNAFQMAEEVLRFGEAATAGALPFVCDGVGVATNGFYDSRTTGPCPQPPSIPNWQAIWADPTKVATYNVGGISYPYYIEQLDNVLDNSRCIGAGLPIPCPQSLIIRWYRITVRGTSSNTNSGVVLLQSTYTR